MRIEEVWQHLELQPLVARELKTLFQTVGVKGMAWSHDGNRSGSTKHEGAYPSRTCRRYTVWGG